VHVSASLCACVCVCVRVCVCVCMYSGAYMCVFVQICFHVCACMCACMCVSEEKENSQREGIILHRRHRRSRGDIAQENIFYMRHYEALLHMRRSTREASWRRPYDPCAPFLFILYHYLEQNLHFGLVPELPQVLSARSFLVAGFDTLDIPRSFSCGFDARRYST